MPEPPADRVTLAGLVDAVRPAEDTVAVSETLPVKPPRLARLIVEVALEPDVKVVVVGLAEIPKSGTFTVTATLCERVPIVADTVTV